MRKVIHAAELIHAVDATSQSTTRELAGFLQLFEQVAIEEEGFKSDLMPGSVARQRAFNRLQMTNMSILQRRLPELGLSDGNMIVSSVKPDSNGEGGKIEIRTNGWTLNVDGSTLDITVESNVELTGLLANL